MLFNVQQGTYRPFTPILCHPEAFFIGNGIETAEQLYANDVSENGSYLDVTPLNLSMTLTTKDVP